MKMLLATMLTGALAAQGLSPAQKALSPRLGTMILRVEAKADWLGFTGWPSLQDLEAAERKADPEIYTDDPNHAAQHRKFENLNPEEAAVWDNPRVLWFQDGARWDAALLMLDPGGNLHLAYLEDAFGTPRLSEVPWFEPELNGKLGPCDVFKDNEVKPGIDFGDGVGDPCYDWDPKEGLVPVLADIHPSPLPDADYVYDGFTLHREDLEGALPRFIANSAWIEVKIKGRWWDCPSELWPFFAKACHLPKAP